jgi:hypothetical protein
MVDSTGNQRQMADWLNNRTWQRLLGLESVDVVRDWHKKFYQRELSTKRATEITSSAKQAREYFKNAANAANTVKSLLTFYGIASLARSVLLLLKPGSGEESLVRGHGLETVNWSTTLSGDLSVALSAIGSLKVRTTAGLFNDFLMQTKNRICMHVRSSAVDWKLDYDQPPLGLEVSLEALFLIVPDLSRIAPNTTDSPFLASISEMSYTDEGGFSATTRSNQFAGFQDSYLDLGYEVHLEGEQAKIKCDSKTFQGSIPQFMHTYVNKMFGSIPSLFIVKPIHEDARLSQLAITYMLAYFMGMLTRYFPTHWVALHSGTKGDGLWPTISATQNYVESVFPELVIELIYDSLSESKVTA